MEASYIFITPVSIHESNIIWTFKSRLTPWITRLGQNFSSQTTDTRVGLFNIHKAERFSLKRQTHISEFNIYDIYRLNGELDC